MGKIENYTNQQSLNGTKGEAFWTHDNKPVEVILTAYENDVTVTVARIKDNIDSTDRNILEFEEFEEKNHTRSVKAARSWAVDWMEDHPQADKGVEDGTYEFTDETSFYELIVNVENGRAVSGTVVDSTGTYDFRIRRNGSVDFDRGMAEDPPSSNDITRKLNREGIPYGED